MRIVYIYREQRTGAFSIEKIFGELSNYIRSKGTELVEYRVGKRSRLLIDVFNLRRMNADIYHITGDVHYFGVFLPKIKTVLTIHDLGHMLHGLSGVKSLLYKLVWFTLPLKMVATITTISEKTKRDLLDNFPYVEDKLVVVPNFYNQNMKFHPLNFNANKPQLLHIGTKKNKNLHNLILSIRDINCRLLIVGIIPLEISNLLHTYNIDYINLANISDEQIYEAYLAADIVTFISTFEGFGMPILEAQIVGRPLITSNIPPMCDIAGDDACLVNPFDVVQIREKLLELINDHCYRDFIVSSGFKNAEKYSIHCVYEKYIAIYNKLLMRGSYD